jgi:ribose transport system substrate-binding protein
MNRSFITLMLMCALAMFVGCEKKPGGGGTTTGGEGPAKILSTEDSHFPVTRTNPKTGKTWTIVGIITDGHDLGQAKALAEDNLVKHPDVKAMIGLWAYNPPKILQAVKGADKLGKIKIIGFDEDPETLQAIAEGHCSGTIVQNPYMFGFRSVEYLSALVRGQEIDIPKNKLIYVPTQVITPDNVSAFKSDIEAKRKGEGKVPEAKGKYDKTVKVKIAFLTNSVDPFWDLAERGCEKAGPVFNAEVAVLKPPGGKVEEQKQMVEEQLALGLQGLAISPIDPANQTEMINLACKKAKVITQDSDAPDTERIFYIGTDNYAAGRQAGELTAKEVPDGGKVIIFVGKMEVLNAQERSQGVIDVLLGQ